LTEFKEKLQFENNLKQQIEYKPKYDFSLKAEEKPATEQKQNNLNK
jgi:hypothetical protein